MSWQESKPPRLGVRGVQAGGLRGSRGAGAAADLCSGLTEPGFPSLHLLPTQPLHSESSTCTVGTAMLGCLAQPENLPATAPELRAGSFYLATLHDQPGNSFAGKTDLFVKSWKYLGNLLALQ